jgi:hypothetical protein
MNRNISIAALAVLGLGVFGAAKANASSIEFQDFYLSYRYIPNNEAPGYAGSTPEEAINLSYANAWTYGSNFFSLDAEQFSLGDPSNTALTSGHSNIGSSEFYGVFRTTLSGDKIFNTKAFTFGPIADIGFQLGGDYDVQNDAFASYKRLIVAGPEFDIALPKGFWSISPQVSHEWDTNGFAYPYGPADSFAVTYEIETAWLYPFNIGPVPLQFTGFANLIGPKGKGYSEPPGYSGDFYHKTEILFHPKLMVDVGSLIGTTPGKLMAGVGYEWWMNKFGSYKPYVEGTQQSSVFFEVGYHFD